MAFRTVSFALLALSITSVAATSGFMRGLPKTSTAADFRNLAAVQSELEEALAEVMGAGHGVAKAQLDATAAKIRPMFDALPKNVYGHIGRDALRYVVHRYFVSQHGWSIKGFEPHGVTMNTTESCVPKVLKQKLPSYIESIMEQKLAHHGFAVTDIVTMVSTLERMIFDESVDILEHAYHLNGEKTSARLGEERLQEVMKSFMMLYAMQAERNNATAHNVEKDVLAESFPDGWAPGDFAASETKAHIEGMKRKNPFVDSSFPFETTSQAASRISEGFGTFQNLECKDLKNVLVSLDRTGNGRIPLADFYAGGSRTNWVFQETPDYLRNLGAIEERSASAGGPALLIPNYVLSMSNCMEPSDYYSICCLSECEGFLGAIEAAVRAPLASPAQIVDVVQGLLLNSVDNPRNLTAQLQSKLDTIADHHNGKVPLHGRLFSQWLHYVFPHECPFPQRGGSHNPLTTSEWMDQGKDIMLSDDDLTKFVGKATELPTEDLFGDGELPTGVTMDLTEWSMDEELYVGHHHGGPRHGGTSQQTSTAKYVFGGLAKLGFAVGVFLALKSFSDQHFPSIGVHKVKTSSFATDVFV